MCRILNQLSLCHRYIDPINNWEGNNITAQQNVSRNNRFRSDCKRCYHVTNTKGNQLIFLSCYVTHFRILSLSLSFFFFFFLQCAGHNVRALKLQRSLSAFANSLNFKSGLLQDSQVLKISLKFIFLSFALKKGNLRICSFIL